MSDIPDLLERFRRGGELLAMATTGAAGTAELDFRATGDEWSVRQIVCHLADAECVGAMRFRQTIAEDNPTIVWYDEKAWAENLPYANRKLSAAVETFRRIRMENYDLLKDLPEGTFARTATHSRFGETTLGGLLKTYAEHAENHVVQLRNVRQKYKESKSK